MNQPIFFHVVNLPVAQNFDEAGSAWTYFQFCSSFFHVKIPKVNGVGREGQWPAAGSRGKRSLFCAAQTTKQDWFELFICFGFLSYMAE